MTSSEFELQDQRTTNRTTPIKWIVSHLIPSWWLILIMLIGAISNGYLAAAIPSYIRKAVDAAEIGDLNLIKWAAIGIFLSQVLRSILQFGRNYSATILGERLERNVREELYTNLLGKSMTFHALRPVGDTMARATNDVKELNLMIAPGLNLVIGSGMFLVMPLFYAPSYHPQLIIVPILFIVLYVVALRRYMKTLQPIASATRMSFGKMNSRLAESLDGIETVKGMAQEQQEITRFTKNAHQYRNALVEQGKVEARFVLFLLYGFAVGAGFAHAVWLFQQDLINTGDIIGYTLLIGLLAFPTFISIFSYAQVARGLASAERILELLNAKTEVDQNKAGYGQPMSGKIEFKNVSAGYTPENDILHNLTFSIEAGQTVAIVGQTGAGKSSLAKLINRTYDAREGSILVDDVDVKAWDLASLRKQISIIEQDVFLFSRTLAENIAFGNPTASQEMVEAAAKKAQAHEFILQFPEGYATVVGTRGVTLSGGQRQRIALARAFLTTPNILILDDSTSAIDSATEDKIQKAITEASAEQTTILITHRLSQIRWADQVILLRQGHIIAQGSHDELLATTPAYQRIFQSYL